MSNKSYLNEFLTILQHCKKLLITLIFTVILMCITEEDVYRLESMLCKIEYIVFEIKLPTVLLLCRSFGDP